MIIKQNHQRYFSRNLEIFLAYPEKQNVIEHFVIASNLIFITVIPGKLSATYSQVYIIGRENDKIRNGFVKKQPVLII